MSAPDQPLAPQPRRSGWLPGAAWLESPNQDERPDGVLPSLLVIHAISLPPGQFSDAGSPLYIDDLFLNRLDCAAHPDFADLKDLRVSAHFLIRRDGTLIQFVSAERRAWHAGRSEFQGRTACNDFSIGVELEGSDLVPFSAAQYDTLADLTLQLCRLYPITDIVGHQDIAPGRKTDPGPFFEWALYQNLLHSRAPLVVANVAMRNHSD